jgi:hypothetical protein
MIRPLVARQSRRRRSLVRSTVPPDRQVHTVSSWPRLLLAIVVGAGMVAACSGGGGTAAPASAGPAATAPTQSSAPAESTAPDATQAPAGAATVDVCAMLSVADVKTIIGADTTGAAEDASNWPDWVAGQCLWSDFGIDVGTPASIAKSPSPTAAEQLAIFKLGMQGFGDVEDVSGVGDGAVYASGFLVAIKGGSAIEITALTLEKDQLIAIAKLVLAKL